MLTLQKVAVTGGISSGKSAVFRFFQELGAFVVYTDVIVHDLLSSSPSLQAKLVSCLGREILSDREKGGVDRKALAERVFKDPDALRQLEQLIHPAVIQKIQELYDHACCRGDYTLFVVEIPLVYETGQESFYDRVVALLARKELCRQRFQAAGFPPGEYDKRMRFQLSPEEKAARADDVIENNGTLDDLKEKVIQLNKKIHT